jgi:hypothetical protein
MYSGRHPASRTRCRNSRGALLCSGLEREVDMNGIEGENESLLESIEHSRQKQRVDICVHALHIATDTSRYFAKR